MIDIIISGLMLIPFMLAGAAIGCCSAEVGFWAWRKIKGL